MTRHSNKTKLYESEIEVQMKIIKTGHRTWNILSRRSRGVADNRASDHGETGNHRGDIEKHNQSNNPRHHHEADEEGN